MDTDSMVNRNMINNLIIGHVGSLEIDIRISNMSLSIPQMLQFVFLSFFFSF